VKLTPEELELLDRLLRAYRLAPAARDVETLDGLIAGITPLLRRSHIDAVA
jgi:hypothetical protein